MHKREREIDREWGRERGRRGISTCLVDDSKVQSLQYKLITKEN